MDTDGTSHIVEVFCACSDIENCTLERYISDVRLLKAELDEVVSQTVDGKVQC